MGLEIILGAIAQKAGNLALNQIVKESSCLSGVRNDLVWIQTLLGRIQSYLKDAEAFQLKTNLASNFMLEMWDLAFDVEDIIDKYFPKLIPSKSPWKHMIIACGFAKEVEAIKERAKDITNAIHSFKIDKSSCGEVITRDPRPRNFPHCNEPNVIGFDKQFEDLVQTVRGEELHRVVSIIGMPGVGKTTLAKKVYNAVRQSFDCSAWIVVSLHPNAEELLRDIARQVGLDKNEMERNVEENLYKFLSARRYLITIDDIWDIEAWNALKPGLPIDSEKGSRIILSSRNKDVSTYVGGLDSVFKLQPLHLQNSRILFYKSIADHSGNITETQDIGEQILERCNGLPLAIVLAAGLLNLRPRSQTAWKAVLDGMGRDEDKCAKIFALSYKDLPLNLRPCFLYFGLFAEDEEIQVFELINLWAAEGFIRGSDVREVEEVGDEYLNHLIARNLIQVVRMSFNGRVRSVRIHDILHDLSIREAKEINFLNIPTDAMNRNDVWKVRRVAMRGISIDHYLSFNPQSSSLRAMLCTLHETQWNRSDAKNLLRDSKYLRVLSVTSYHKISRFLLTEICNLRQLTFLQLGSALPTALELPYAISNLTNLLTLDVRQILCIRLPNVIWRMKQLKHLLLSELSSVASSSYREKLDVFLQVEFSSTNLQTLYRLPADIFPIDWWHKLTNLRKLRVSWPSDEFFEILSGATPISHKLEDLCLYGYITCQKLSSLNLSRYENLHKLKIDDIHRNLKFDDVQLGSGVPSLPQHDKLPPNLTKLTLYNTHLKKDPMETVKKLQNLKILKLGPSSYLGKILDCSGNFPQLEVFKIKDLDELEMVIIEEGGMPRLKDFKILYCSPETQIPDTIRAIMINEDYRMKKCGMNIY